MDEINTGDIERVLNDTRPVTSVDEAQDQQPVHIGGAVSGVVLPAADDAGPGEPHGEAPRKSEPGEADAAEPGEFDAPHPGDHDAPASGGDDAPPAATDTAGDDLIDEDAVRGEAFDDGEDEHGFVEPAEPIPDVPLFSEIGLSDELVRAVTEKGYLHPTPIQAQAIPFVLMGRDVMGVAQTGTGKTASFTLPMLDILSGSRSRARMPRALVLEPTRELALQVAENFVDYGRHLKLTHALLIGGESMNDQRAALDKGVDVLIATPGRLLDLFERGGLMLNDTKILVIDEADRMLDMGFIPDVEKIVSFVSPLRQTLFFSATMAPEIKRLADAFLQNPKLITVSKAASVAPTIVAGLAVVDEAEKRRALRTLISVADVRNALIFCNRKRDVDVLFKSLTKHGFSAGALHGDLPQSVRFATLERFKSGDIKMLVCSDVAARGIDIGGLSHVFNFDIPIHAEDYVHRIGRTGRAGLTGHAYSIATPDDRLVVDAIERLTGFPIPRITVEGVDTQPWSEIDGARRRGGRRGGGSSDRGGDKSGGRGRGETRRDAPPHEARPANPERQKRAENAERPMRQDREARAPRPEREARPAAERRPETAAPAQHFERDRPPRRDAEERPRRDGERVYRREDLGPSVLGFGDSVPDFMNLPRRAASTAARGRAAEPEHEDFGEQDVAIIDDAIPLEEVFPEEDRISPEPGDTED